MSKHSSSGLIRRGGNQRNGIDPIWWAPTLFIVIGGLVALTAASFSGKFRPSSRSRWCPTGRDW